MCLCLGLMEGNISTLECHLTFHAYVFDHVTWLCKWGVGVGGVCIWSIFSTVLVTAPVFKSNCNKETNRYFEISFFCVPKICKTNRCVAILRPFLFLTCQHNCFSTGYSYIVPTQFPYFPVTFLNWSSCVSYKC